MPPQPPPTLEDALNFIDLVQQRFNGGPPYGEFLSIMQNYKRGMISAEECFIEVSTLFAEHSDLIDGFCVFLPVGFFG